jgi:hypothetical protein
MKIIYQVKIFNLFLSLFFIVSCSSTSSIKTEEKSPVETKEKTKIYSPETQKEFEKIEKGDTRNARSGNSKSKPKLPPKENPKETSPEVAYSGKLSLKNQERLQEINQNLAFYCMKHRQDRAFSSEEKCLKFTKVVLKACEKKHVLINKVMVNCIKDRLKKHTK